MRRHDNDKEKQIRNKQNKTNDTIITNNSKKHTQTMVNKSETNKTKQNKSS